MGSGETSVRIKTHRKEKVIVASIFRIGDQGEKNCALKVHSGLTSRIF